MKVPLKIAYLILTLIFLIYVALPSADFPSAPLGAVQSFEPADTETPLRRAYFTNLNREEVMAHYKGEFTRFPTLNLNYPPEEAQTIIRDQTRSSYLEELVHPFRESLYINGFVPKEKKDTILINGDVYYQKITVRYVPSQLLIRILFVLVSSVILYVLIHRVASLIKEVTVWSINLIKK